MWTPRRVLMLIKGVILCLVGYAVYAFLLGNIDGLPPLSAEYLPDVELPGPVVLNDKDRMIQQAFGEDCKELGRPIRLLVHDKGMVIAAGQFSFEDDGRVKLCPFSAALFPKNKLGGFPEINTVKCDFAFLTFDKPVQSPSELSSRKLTAVELRGGGEELGVTITNNRGTKEKKDDIEIFVTQSPLFYEERRDLIWTDGYVMLKDYQSQPVPTRVTAMGMDLYLTPESSPNKPRPTNAAPGPKADNLGNVKLLVLRANVRIDLFVEAGDGFLGSSGDAKPPPAAAVKPATPEKDHVFIETRGPFTYDPNTEKAKFESPPVQLGGQLPNAQQQVLASRKNPESKVDQLFCNRLDLQLRKKAPPSGPRDGLNDPNGSSKEIESAVATVRPGQEIQLVMDTQNLEAVGTELYYNCAEPGRGPKTRLIGNFMRADRDGHKIKALDLQMTGNDKFGNGQAVYAKGPGRVDLTDKDKPKTAYPVHILWKDTLVSVRERDGDMDYEVWTITGDAAYIDDDQKQEMHAQKIQVWLEPTDSARGGPRASGGPKQRIHKIEAFGRVRAISPEAIIKRADHLLIVMRPDIASGAELPTLPEPPPQKSTGTHGPRDVGFRMPRATQSDVLVQAAALLPNPPPERRVGDVSEIRVALPPPGAATQTANAGPAVAPAAPAKPPPRKPIVLDADDVVIYVATLGGKKQLEKLDANGKVHVVQDAEKAGEKGLDIVGDLLNLVHDAPTDLNVLTVFGDSRKFLARLEMNDTILLGPKVTIDQVKNRADVDGQGAMEMPSKTSLDGERPARPGARMTIHWNKNMTFDGKIAWFFGGVQGFQDDASIKCESMQTVMDRMVVFKEGHKDGDGAKVERMVCSTRVYVKDEQFDKDHRIEKASRLECRELDVDNRFGPTRAVGPGRFWHLAPGDSDAGPAGQPAVPKKGPAAQAPKAKQLHLTRIDFKGWMWSNTKANFKNATFRDNVEVFHVPSETFEIALDADKLPKDGFYIRCEKLSMATRQVDKKTVQSMIAEYQVTFKTQTDYGICDVLRFDEANDIIILEAAPGNLVKLYRFGPGGKKDTIPGEKILYNRKDGTFKVDKAGVINSSRLDVAPARPTITSFQPESTLRAALECGKLVARIARA